MGIGGVGSVFPIFLTVDHSASSIEEEMVRREGTEEGVHWWSRAGEEERCGWLND